MRNSKSRGARRLCLSVSRLGIACTSAKGGAWSRAEPVQLRIRDLVLKGRLDNGTCSDAPSQGEPVGASGSQGDHGVTVSQSLHSQLSVTRPTLTLSSVRLPTPTNSHSLIALIIIKSRRREFASHSTQLA